MIENGDPLMLMVEPITALSPSSLSIQYR